MPQKKNGLPQPLAGPRNDVQRAGGVEHGDTTPHRFAELPFQGSQGGRLIAALTRKRGAGRAQTSSASIGGAFSSRGRRTGAGIKLQNTAPDLRRPRRYGIV